MMSERPINMSADQVQALLAGKTQHRVVLEPQPVDAALPDGRYIDSYCGEKTTPENPRGMSRDWCVWTKDNRQGRDFAKVPCKPGDRLWVREAFTTGWPMLDGDVLDQFDDAGNEKPQCIWYGADGNIDCWLDGDGYQRGVPWKSGALMPRRLSRLTLIVTDVRVQRLQEISEEDAIAEGFRGWYSPQHPDFGVTDALLPHQEFAMAWDDQHPAPEHQWEANPWVCALTFRVVHQNIDEVKT